MNPDPLQTAWTSPDLPLALLGPAALLALALWVRSHAWSRTASGWRRAPAFAGRATLGFLALLALASGARHAVVFATPWQIWPFLLGGAILIETVLALGRAERNLVPRRIGIAIALARAASVLALILMLCQPVLVHDTFRRLQRHVVVLFDVSGSMQVRDDNLTPAEKIRLSAALGEDAARRPVALDRIALRWREAGRELLAQTDWLGSLSQSEPALRVRQLERQARAHRKTLKRIGDTVEDATNGLGRACAAAFLPKESPLRADMARLAGQLATDVGAPLHAAIKLTGDWRPSSTNSGAAYDDARQTLQRVSAAIAEGETRLAAISEAFDEAFYRALPEADRKRMDRVAELPRVALARRLLLGREDAPTTPPLSPGLLERLDRDYGARLYTFGATPAEWRTPAFAATGAVARLSEPPARQRHGTDLAEALLKASTDLLPEHTAGILLFTDGRHNAAEPVEPIARKLGVAHVPIYPVVFGGNRHPPTDAALAAIDAPDSVSTNDRVSFNLELKLDGLAGTNVTVTLYDGAMPVASNTVTPDAPAFRKTMLLSDVPRTNGLHAYRVAVQSFASEVNVSNNVRHLPVLVSSDAIKVLLVDGYPRWEFRYLKNLFMERDRSVRLQYLLFHPDEVKGITNRPPRYACATPDQTESEATLPPENEAEWMKFDVIILGDVSPAELGPGAQDILRRYVTNRGGTLIVIAGSRHMPHAYANSPLADILPVTVRPSSRPILKAPEDAFRLSLTAQGRDTVLMKLADDAAGNRAAWHSLPELHWRHGSLVAKPGASVLAYAVPHEPGQADRPARLPEADRLLQQQQVEREAPLIVTHQAGYGSVLMFGFDHSWRLRYRKGDAYHHKLWGQVLRWATADRIASGTAPVRIGTVQPRYTTGNPVRIVARLATPQFMPVVNAAPHATLWRDNQRVTRRKLVYRPESPGLYVTDVGTLPEGHYRVELETDGIPALADPSAPPASADFSVTAERESETVELAADRGLLNGVATLTGGKVLEPFELETVAERLGPPRVTRAERRQVDLWNAWPWLLAIIALLTLEWILRKRARLP